MRKIRRSTQEFKKLGSDLIGVEVGVDKGDNSLTILENVSIKKLYLVDPYIKYIENSIEMDVLFGYDRSQSYNMANELLKQYSNKIVWVKKESHNSISDIPNNVDFVYIDGNHQADSVRIDIEDWYPKVRQGGILAGHDYHMGHVRSVVDNFASNNKLKVGVGIMPHNYGDDWFIIKEINA